MNRCFRALVALVCTFGALWLHTPARAQAYQMDILSRDFYPQLRDSWMFHINNQGVAAGYIATQSSSGPYLPTTYTGNGQFQPFGIESSLRTYIVAGFNDSGVAVGNLNLETPYIHRNGAVEYPAFPADAFPYVYGLNNSGLIYGSGFVANSNVLSVFTINNSTLNFLPMSAPGLVHFDSDLHLISDTGLLGIIGYSADYSVFQRFLYDIPTGTLSPFALPAGYNNFTYRITEAGLIYGRVSAPDGTSRYGFWNSDGSFRDFFDVPTGTTDILFNNVGQAIGLNAGQVQLFDGIGWSGRDIYGLNGYTLQSIRDFNDRGQFVGLALNSQRNFLWGYVANPVPEPSAVLVLGLGSIGLGMYVRGLRRRASRAVDGRKCVRPVYPRYEAKVWVGWLGLCAILVLPAGCSNGSGGNGITREALIGSWLIRTMALEGGQSVTCPGSVEIQPNFVLTCASNQGITFNADGTVQSQFDSEVSTGTWTLNGSTVTVTVTTPDNTISTTSGTAQISGNSLTLSAPSGFPGSENQQFITVYDKTTTLPPLTQPPPGGGQGGGGIGGSSRPVSDYVGTWSGAWNAPGSMFPLSLPQNGTMTLTFDAGGVISGSIVNATTGQSGAVSGQLTVENGQTQGMGNATLTLGGRPGSFGFQFTIGSDGKLFGSVFVPAQPGDEPTLMSASAVYSLTRQ